MRMPGFTAEASLYKSTGCYIMATSCGGIQAGLVEAAQASINCPWGLVPVLVKKQVSECLKEGPLESHIDRWEPLNPSNPAFGRFVRTITLGCILWGPLQEVESWECGFPIADGKA